MTRQCNDCENPADVDMLYLPPLSNNKHQFYPCCAKCALKLHRKTRNKPRNAFYLRVSMEQEQVLRELL
jgi:hypothetical protein